MYLSNLVIICIKQQVYSGTSLRYDVMKINKHIKQWNCSHCGSREINLLTPNRQQCLLLTMEEANKQYTKIIALLTTFI